ncbi:hypothetical protein NPIL_262751 [Nephila pilipes]|uniref:Uncharacterized protein n=1 Tax=Nephila pilipes TaxID=299642 RepID=A0A8X6P745_NEPPI|nr:hypothetical protein NPIL_262751 [Nephila pilipes]
MDAFPAAPSSTVLPVWLPDKTDALEHVVRQGLVKAFISYQEPQNNRILTHFLTPPGLERRLFFYFWTEKSRAGHDSSDSDDKCSSAHLRVAPSSRRSQAEPNLYRRHFEP